MEESNIAKRYAKAVCSLYDHDEIVKIYDICALVSRMFGISKFSTIVVSQIISKEEKLALVKSLVEIPICPSAEKFLTLLVYSDRLSILPWIVFELKKKINAKTKIYEAILHTKQQLTEVQIADIQTNLAKKLDITLSIVQQIEPSLDGIKLEVIGLGIEIAFSKNKFTHELQEYILKAV